MKEISLDLLSIEIYTQESNLMCPHLPVYWIRQGIVAFTESK